MRRIEFCHPRRVGVSVVEEVVVATSLNLAPWSHFANIFHPHRTHRVNGDDKMGLAAFLV